MSTTSMKDLNKNRRGYKETKAGWIPNEWSCKQLGSIATLFSGGTPSMSQSQYWGGHIPWYSARDLKKLRLKESVAQVTEAGAKNGTRIVSPGTILVLVRGMMLNRDFPVGITTQRSCFNQDLKAIVTDESQCCSDYLAYSLIMSKMLFLSQVDRSSHGTGKLGTSIILTTHIAIPEVKERKMISNIIFTHDATIDRNRDLITAKKQQKKALMQQLLTGKKRLPGFKNEWCSHRLGDLFHERREANSDHLDLLAITASRGIIPASAIDRKDSSSEDKSRYKVIKPGDIGYNTMRMWQGVSAVSHLEGIVSPAYTVCTPAKGVDVEFMGYFFKFQPIVYLFWRFSQGLVDDTLSLKFPNFSVITVKVPKEKEQHAIAEVLAAADAEITLLEEKHASLQLQKMGLMQKLLTGTIRVKS